MEKQIRFFINFCVREEQEEIEGLLQISKLGQS